MTSPKRAAARATLLAAALALAGCGTGSPGGSPAAPSGGGEVFAPPPPSATAAATPPTPTPAAATPTPGEEQRGAAQIMADAIGALAMAPSVHLTGHSTDDQGTLLVELDKTPDAARQLTTDASGIETLIVAGGRAYAARGRGAFTELPADAAAKLVSLTLGRMVACLRREHGTYTRGALSTIAGRRVIAVSDDGRAPGAAPSTLFVAVDGPPQPVRLTIDGRVTPGGGGDCGHPLDATVTSASFDFDFTRPVPVITAPPA